MRRRWFSLSLLLVIVAAALSFTLVNRSSADDSPNSNSTGATSELVSANGPQATAQVSSAAAGASPSAKGASATTGSYASVADLVAAVNPAVVTVINEQTFRGFGQSGQGNVQPAGSGTGFIISQDGYVVTNNHVVEGSDALKVIFADGTEVDATLIGADAVSDLAVIQIPAADVKATLSLGDSGTLQVGQAVVAIGSALGEYTNTVTEGIVSGLGRSLDSGNGSAGLEDLIQHDAAINPGNSGGPLLNLNGEVVGVNTAVVRYAGNGEPAEGLGFAIPSNTVKEITSQLIGQGAVERPYLGIAYAMLTPEIAAAQGLSVQQGAYVQQVAAGSPAATAGIETGDVIVSIGGTQLDADHSLQDALFAHQPGETVKLAVYRSSSNQTQTLDVTLGTRPSNP